jgi:hypothetical protein
MRDRGIMGLILNKFIGIPAVFELAKQYGKTPGEINDIVQNWSIFLVGVSDTYPFPLGI